MKSFALASCFAILAPLLAPGCSSAPQSVGQLPDGGNPGDGGSGGCSGSAPLCFGNDVQMCCGNDPAGSAVCQGGQWTCGGAPAPGCNGTSCTALDAGPPLDGSSGTDGSLVSDATTDGSGPDCGCPAGTICVGTRAIGGAQFTPDDAGACPQGMHPETQQGSLVCERDFSYECMAPPAPCSANIDCACAGSSYCAPAQMCVDPSSLPANANLSPNAVLVCELAVP